MRLWNISLYLDSDGKYSRAYEDVFNSNIASIKRWGVYDRVEGSTEEGIIDDISLEFYGNQPIRAYDNADALNYSGANDFADGEAQFYYDSNGNMVYDSSRGIESIEYNRLNQPVRIDFTGSRKSVTFEYDAAGTKIAEIDTVPIDVIGPIGPIGPVIPVIPVNPNGTIGGSLYPEVSPLVRRTYYLDNLVYVNGKLERVLFPGGYATPASSGSGYDYHYYICDYQGNVRAVVNESGNLEERNSYYPYGMLMPAEADGKLPAKQTYKWSGKEYLTIHGINLYDFGPRALFSPLGIFTQPDPQCESYPGISPYIYCAGNPVNLVDPTGQVIVACSSSTQQMIRNTLPKDASEFIKFDDKGILCTSLMSKYKNDFKSDNFNDLLEMALNKDLCFEVLLTSAFEYLDADGNLNVLEMELDDTIYDDVDDEGMGLRTGEEGHFGHCNYPGFITEESNSPNGNLQIIVNSKLSEAGRAQSFSHECYGHAYLFMKTNGNRKLSGHDTIGMRETNNILYERINRSINETILNMK